MDGNEYVVGWGTLALINAGLAQSKNRSGFVWFVLSLVFGPVATLFIVVAVEQPPKRHARSRPDPRDQPDRGDQPDDSDPGQTTPAQGS